MQSLTFNQKLGRFIVNWVLLFLVWLMFTSTLFWQEVLIGAALTMVISLLSIRLFTCCTISIFNPVKIFWMIWYFFVFLKALIIANFDVARRVISHHFPSIPVLSNSKPK